MLTNALLAVVIASLVLAMIAFWDRIEEVVMVIFCFLVVWFVAFALISVVRGVVNESRNSRTERNMVRCQNESIKHDWYGESKDAS